MKVIRSDQGLITVYIYIKNGDRLDDGLLKSAKNINCGRVISAETFFFYIELFGESPKYSIILQINFLQLKDYSGTLPSI